MPYRSNHLGAPKGGFWSARSESWARWFECLECFTATTSHDMLGVAPERALVLRTQPERAFWRCSEHIIARCCGKNTPNTPTSTPMTRSWHSKTTPGSPQMVRPVAQVEQCTIHMYMCVYICIGNCSICITGLTIWGLPGVVFGVPGASHGRAGLSVWSVYRNNEPSELSS